MSDISTYFGLTRKNYGRRYSLTSTHLNGEEILQDENLNPNTMIVSSPVVQASNNILDTQGTQVAHSLFFTDYEGNPTRLTYTILPGNGLVVNAYNSTWNNFTRPYTCDTLTFEIDHDSLKTTDDKGQLYVSKPDIIDNYTLMVTQVPNSPHSYISVITANLEKATNVKFGITRGDNYTISAKNGILNVNTYNLDYVDDISNTPGIIRPNPVSDTSRAYWTVEANNGILHVITANLDRANTQQLGVVKTDGVSTVTNANGVLSVRTAGLTHGDAYNFGIVKVDDITIHSLNGIINADSTRMTPTAINTETGESTFGVIKLDPICFGIDTNNCTYINRYNELITLLDRYLHDYQFIMDWLADHESRIRALENQAAAEFIYIFRSVSDTSTILAEPTWNAEAQHVEDPQQLVSLQFHIKTNCSFNVSVTYKDNENPGITLQNVKLGNGEVVSASGLSHHIFSSTNKELNTLHMTFNCTNFNGSDVVHVARILTTANITVTSINDDSISRVCTHTFLRWNRSDYVEPIEEPEEPTITEDFEDFENSSVSYSNYKMDICNMTNNMAFDEATHTCVILNNANAGTLTSGSLSFKLSRTKTVTVHKMRTTYKYEDGRLVSSDTQELGEETTSTTEFFSVPLISSIANSLNDYEFGLSVTPKSFNRPINISNEQASDYLLDDNTWTDLSNTQDSLVDADKPWYTYSTPILASTTARLISTNDSQYDVEGFNVLNVASTAPTFTKDRKLKLTLNVMKRGDESANSSFDAAWTPCTDIDEFTLLFVENFNPTDCSMAVVSEVQANVETPLKITISKSNLIPYQSADSTFSVIIHYMYNTPSGRTAMLSSSNTAAESSSSLSDSENTLKIIIHENDAPNGVEQLVLGFRHGESLPVVVGLNGEDKYNLDNDSEDSFPTIVEVESVGTDIENVVPQSVANIISFNTTERNVSNNDSANNVTTHSTQNYTNNVSGFYITHCECTGFVNNPEIEHSSIGQWPTYQPEPEQEITFSDAAITKITVDPWDDTMMRFRFNISPGANTHIPVGSQVYLRTSSDSKIVDGVTARNTGNNPLAVKMYVNAADNTPYNYSEFYDHIVASCDGWTNTGCEFDILLENIWQPAPNPNVWSVTSQIVYEAEEEQLCFANNNENNSNWSHYDTGVTTQMYVEGSGRGSTTTTTIPKSMSDKLNSQDGGPKSSTGLTNDELNAQNVNHPMVYKLWAIRFNFTIEAKTDDGKTTVMDFTPTIYDLCSKISFDNATYNKSTSQNVNMLNAFYHQDNAWDSSSDVYGFSAVSQLAAATTDVQTDMKDVQDALFSLSSYIEEGMSVDEAILKVAQDLKESVLTHSTTNVAQSSTVMDTGNGNGNTTGLSLSQTQTSQANVQTEQTEYNAYIEEQQHSSFAQQNSASTTTTTTEHESTSTNVVDTHVTYNSTTDVTNENMFNGTGKADSNESHASSNTSNTSNTNHSN